MEFMEDFSCNLISKVEEMLLLNPFIIVNEDKSDLVEYVNDDFFNLFGFEKMQIIGLSLDKLLDSKSYLNYKKMNSGSFDAEFSFKLKNRFSNIKAKKARIHGSADKDKLFYVNFSVDEELKILMNIISDKCEDLQREFKKVNENEQRWKMALYGSNAGVWDWNANENKSFFSKEWKEMLGYENEEISSNPSEWDNRIHHEDRERVLNEIEMNIKNQKDSFESVYRIRKKDSSYLWVQDRGKVTERNEDNSPKRMLGIQVDISERIKIEKELEISKIEAEKASAIKGTFLANMTHELRTPLNGIIGTVDILNEKITDASLIEYIEMIKFSSRSLLEIINEILDFSKIESGKIDLEIICFNAKELFENIKKSFQHSAKLKKVDLILNMNENIPENLLGDPTRIKQILFNLTSNAMKFTDKGKIEITVDFKQRVTDKNMLFIKVEDTGIGIPENKIEEIFEAYSQSDNSISRKYGGTGLGLNITKSLIQMMCGTITVNSSYGNGSEFIVSIPIESCESKYEADDKVIDLEGKNVLIADDNLINRKIIGNMLQKMNAICDYCRNGREVLEKAAKDEYSIVFMDLQMPLMDGFETTRAIRKGVLNSDVQIYAITAHDETIRDRCFEAGMNGVIYKPFEKDNLINELSKFKNRIDKRENKDIENIMDREYFEGMSRIEIKELYEQFFRTFPEQIYEIKKSLREKNIENLKKIIHSLKSVVYMMVNDKTGDMVKYFGEYLCQLNLVIGKDEYEFLKLKTEEIEKNLFDFKKLFLRKFDQR